MSPSPEPQILLDASGLAAAVNLLANSIHIRHGNKPLALVGLLSRGDFIARRISSKLKELGHEIELGYIDISLYRDDLGQGNNPMLRSSHLPFSVDGAHIILVDDVLFTGRTIRAALNAVMDYGRPSQVELAVLIDRGGREMPIQPDYIGYTSRQPGARIAVSLFETDGIDRVVLA